MDTTPARHCQQFLKVHPSDNKGLPASNRILAPHVCLSPISEACQGMTLDLAIWERTDLNQLVDSKCHVVLGPPRELVEDRRGMVGSLILQAHRVESRVLNRQVLRPPLPTQRLLPLVPRVRPPRSNRDKASIQKVPDREPQLLKVLNKVH